MCQSRIPEDKKYVVAIDSQFEVSGVFAKFLIETRLKNYQTSEVIVISSNNSMV